MREMTTAEFAKANLAALAEPVSVRRYTQVVGTYYPMGYEPASAPPPPTLGLTEPVNSLIGDLGAAEKHVRDLELEVKRLKQELAKRPAALEVPEAFRPKPAAVGVLVNPRKSEDPFAGLAKQDREFFERKLGTKKK
jgi:hypothetical protein